MNGKLIKISTLATLLVLFAFAGAAQAAKGAGKGAKAGTRGPLMQVQEALDKLTLSDEQVKKIGDVISDAQQQFQTLRNEARSSGDKTAARQKLRTLMSDTLKKISQQLTPEQRTQFRAELKTIREQRKAQHSPSTQPTT